MQKIVRICKNIYNQHSIIVISLAIIIDILLLLYYLIFIPFWPETGWVVAHEEIWYSIYRAFSPFTSGAYLTGIVVIAHFLFFKSIIAKALISIFYGLIICISLIVMMGMTSVWELYIYLPHLAIIIICILVCKAKYTS